MTLSLIKVIRTRQVKTNMKLLNNGCHLVCPHISIGEFYDFMAQFWCTKQGVHPRGSQIRGELGKLIVESSDKHIIQWGTAYGCRIGARLLNISKQTDVRMLRPEKFQKFANVKSRYTSVLYLCSISLEKIVGENPERKTTRETGKGPRDADKMHKNSIILALETEYKLPGAKQ